MLSRSPLRLNLHRTTALSLRHSLSTTATRQTSFKQHPSPPRLPKEEQETFESLTKASLGAFSSPPSSSSPTPETEVELLKLADDITKHKDLLTGGEKPLFEGEKNPVTGEVGGPKTDPTKYGDWSFNGRVTDF
ncbi:hypothetical protein ABW20_dc0100766 [Dactylellina cionopaga]|nr:hypothetical protein ABW20_dc0100766 [Dactylellina cionopaga]